jgi:hypothetical protein
VEPSQSIDSFITCDSCEISDPPDEPCQKAVPCRGTLTATGCDDASSSRFFVVERKGRDTSRCRSTNRSESGVSSMSKRV